jgi:aspartate/tyrosine/aromatic aminotransferase
MAQHTAHFPTTEWNPPDDPILGLTTAFRKDTRSNKVNLGVGAYRTASGEPFVLSSVQEAERQLFEAKLNKEYLPIDGDGAFVQATHGLIFGSLAGRLPLFGAQALGGTGALRIGAEYLALGGVRTIYLSTPTWANHKNIFSRGGLKVESYPYYDPLTHTVNFPAMLQAIQAMPAGSAILLHGCCHNPTGMDLTQEQWHALSDALLAQGVIPFFDLAYQGFGEGLDADAYPIRYFAEKGHELIVAYSFAKNFGLYGERVGFITFVAKDAAAAERVGRQVRPVIRANYSSPPLHGERIVTTILQSESLTADWHRELETMRLRVIEMRKALAAGLCAKGLSADSYHTLLSQRGLFSYGFLTHDQVQHLRQEFAIYCPDDGRINVAGLNPKNVGYVIDAIESVYASAR